MKRTILIGIIAILAAACEDDLIRCQLRSGEYEVFEKDEIVRCTDKDGDGIMWLEDCDDLDELKGGGDEISLTTRHDGRDNDCDGFIDEGDFDPIGFNYDN